MLRSVLLADEPDGSASLTETTSPATERTGRSAGPAAVSSGARGSGGWDEDAMPVRTGGTPVRDAGPGDGAADDTVGPSRLGDVLLVSGAPG